MSIAICPANKGRHPVTDPDWGAHKLPCPDPVNCQGRSNVYGPWTGDETIRKYSIMDRTHGCTVSQYINKMKESYYDPGTGVLINRYTGRTAAGAIPALNTWSDVWGSTVLIETWPGQHQSGTRRGSALVNIDGAGLFRTYQDYEVVSAPFRQVKRYEQE